MAAILFTKERHKLFSGVTERQFNARDSDFSLAHALYGLGPRRRLTFQTKVVATESETSYFINITTIDTSTRNPLF